MSQQEIKSAATFDAKYYQLAISKGEFQQVIAELSTLISANTLNIQDKVQALYIKAVALRLNKHHQQALHCLDTLAEQAPNYSRMYQEKGYNFRAIGNSIEAAKNFYAATQSNPALLSAWQALKPIYQAQKQQQALDLCVAQIKQLSSLPRPILAATDLMYEGNLDGADITCRQFLQQNKHHPKALLLLAEIAQKLKAISEAEFILETCVELEKNNLEAKYQLFKVYSKLGKFEDAFKLANELTQLAPENLFYQVALATSTQGVGKIEEAINILENINRANGEQAQVCLLLGHAYKTTGNISKSVSAYKKAYQIEPTLGDALWSLANTKTYQFSESEIAMMEDYTSSKSTKVTDKIHFHFALGKAYEDLNMFEKSFKHYELGNKEQHLQTPFNIASHTQFVEHQIASFTIEFRDKVASHGCDSKDPIFIIGMPRAGSTLLEQILASHSQVDGTMELHEILGLAAKLSKKHHSMPSYPLNLAEIPNETLKKLGEDFINRTSVYRENAPYFIDKMPNNYMHIGLIKTILPNAKIIDARRSPMACCFSGFKQLFGDGQEFSYDLKTIGLYYQNYIRLMSHWNTVFPGEILQVNNEDIIDNTEFEIRRLLTFCDLPFEESCLHFYKNKRSVKTPSAQQVRQPIYSSGKNQWENFKPYLEDLMSIFE